MWGCSKKYEAREQTIIQPYRQHFTNTLPINKQYWSMCGDCSDVTGKFRNGCEPDQLIKNGLITPNQFNGVEILKEFHDHNINTRKDINWYNNDFYQEMVESINKKNFNPGIVNSDLILMPKRGIPYFSKIMNLLTSQHITNVMLVGNFILRNRGIVVQPNEIIEELEKVASFRVSMNIANWKFDNKIYVYNGSGMNRTVLGSVIFYL